MTPAEYRKIRRQLGLSQAELARVLGITRESVSRRETGQQVIDAEAALAIEALADRADLGLTSRRSRASSAQSPGHPPGAD